MIPQPAALAVELARAAAALELTLAPEVVDRVARYGVLLLRWNRRVNLLSSRVDPKTLVERHLLDSLALLRLVRPAGAVLDVGSGAGLPALPLRIAAPDQQLTLLEPSAKRASLLRAAARELGLDRVTVRAQRLEATDPSARFDLLLSRATFAPDEWVTRAAPFCAAEGRVVVMLGRRPAVAVEKAAKDVGLAVVAEDEFELPWSGAQRRNLLIGRPRATSL